MTHLMQSISSYYTLNYFQGNEYSEIGIYGFVERFNVHISIW